MFGKLTDALSVFRKGEAVANPAAWHDANSMGTTLAVFIVALLHLAKDFGYDLNIDLPTVDKVSIGIAAAVAWILNNIASPHGGFLPARAAEAASAEGQVSEFGKAGFNTLLEHAASSTVPSDTPTVGLSGVMQSIDQAADTAKKQAEQTFDQRG